MKIFNATHLSQKPADVFAAAREDGAIIQQKRTNGEVIEEFVLLPFKADHGERDGTLVAYEIDGRHALMPGTKKGSVSYYGRIEIEEK